jgi:hypothetical protein
MFLFKELIMSLIKSLKNRIGQSVLEYILLVAVSIIAFIGSAMLMNSNFKEALENHFSTVQSRIKVY